MKKYFNYYFLSIISNSPHELNVKLDGLYLKTSKNAEDPDSMEEYTRDKTGHKIRKQNYRSSSPIFRGKVLD